MTWAIKLGGESFDLEALAESLVDGDAKVYREGQDFYLVSDEFEKYDDAKDVLAAAKDMVSILSGGCRLALRRKGTDQRGWRVPTKGRWSTRRIHIRKLCL